MLDSSLLPQLSASTQAFIRAGYGLLMIATLVQALPEARRFFLSERWGGYARSSRDVDAVQNPVVMPLLMAIWFAAAAALVVGWASPWPALINLMLCRYFFIHMRWKGVLRGMGAPGFLAYWVGLAVFLLEYTSRFAPASRALALLVLQVDLALVMLSAGIYKFTAGYPRNHGMELGLCNPMWGYWWKWYSARRPNSPIFWTMNQLAWGTEVVAALMMLVPATRELGALLLIASFLFILTHIRLGFLCEMVAVSGLLYIVPGGMVDRWIAGIAAVPVIPVTGGIGVAAANAVLDAALCGYLIALPFAHAGLYYNFYARRSLPAPLQRVLERYTNAFGIIIWRVFSVDVVNFSSAWREPREGRPVPVSRLGSWPVQPRGRDDLPDVAFTTLKYYPSNDATFAARAALRRTLPRAPGTSHFRIRECRQTFNR
jgi:hypothetical protein